MLVGCQGVIASRLAPTVISVVEKSANTTNSVGASLLAMTP